MGPTQFLIGLLLISSAICQEDDEEVTVEHVKHEDDIVYLTPDHHPDVYFSDHFDHQVNWDGSNILNYVASRKI